MIELDDKELNSLLKVLYLLNHAGKAGTERYVQTLIEKLNNNKTKAYFAYNEEGLLVERLKAIGIETFRIPMKHPLDLKAAWNVSRLCKRLGIQLIHTQFLRENYIAILSRIFNPKVRVMYTNHFIMANNAVLKLFNRLLTPFESAIIAVCNKGREVMVANGNKASIIKVIFNAVDPLYWKEPVKSTLREEYGIGGDVFVLLCASRFAHDKGHRYLVDAIAELKKITGAKFKCVLAGDGPLLEDVKTQVRTLALEEDIIFTGFRSDIKNLYYGSDLYINSSEHEALSFLIIEALASGLPVIATDMGGNSDIINKETDCGILVKYDDPVELAEAIDRVIRNRELRDKLRENAFRTVDERFNIEKMSEETYNLYLNSVIKSRK